MKSLSLMIRASSRRLPVKLRLRSRPSLRWWIYISEIPLSCLTVTRLSLSIRRGSSLHLRGLLESMSPNSPALPRKIWGNNLVWSKLSLGCKTVSYCTNTKRGERSCWNGNPFSSDISGRSPVSIRFWAESKRTFLFTPSSTRGRDTDCLNDPLLSLCLLSLEK